jgi:hypothetical protein
VIKTTVGINAHGYSDEAFQALNTVIAEIFYFMLLLRDIYHIFSALIHEIKCKEKLREDYYLTQNSRFFNTKKELFCDRGRPWSQILQK